MSKGVICTCMLRYLKPRSAVQTAFPNANAKKRIEGLIVLRRETIPGPESSPDKHRLYVQSDEVMDGDKHIEIFGHPRYFAIVTVCSADGFFDEDGVVKATTTTTSNEDIEELPEEVAALLSLYRPIDEDDIFGVRGIVEFDDDNNPAPENIPSNEPEPVAASMYGNWGILASVIVD
jgi:hypothetical protein